MADALVWGYKAIAEVAGDLTERGAQDLACVRVDPLPVFQIGEGRCFAKRSRVESHRRRHAKGAVHPVEGLALLRGWAAVARVVHLSVSRAMALAPWATGTVECPLPVFRLPDGTIAAYLDALRDWFDLLTQRAVQPRIQRALGGVRARKAKAKATAAKKRGKGKRGRGLLKSASARSEKKAARVPPTCQEGSTGAAQ